MNPGRGAWLEQADSRRLRPMELGDLLDHAFRLYRQNLGCFFGIVLCINIFVFALENAMGVENANRRLAAAITMGADGSPQFDFASMAGPAAVLWGFFMVRFALLSQLSMAAVTYAASRLFLGESAGIAASYWAVLPRFPLLVATGLLAGLCSTAGFALACIPGLCLMAAFVFAPFEVVLERSGPVRAIARSFELIVLRSTGRRLRHNLFKISMILTLFTLVSLAAYALASTPRLALYGYYHWIGQRPEVAVSGVVERLLRTIEYFGISAAEPLGMIALVLLYYDVRMRAEGFDLERYLASRPA